MKKHWLLIVALLFVVPTLCLAQAEKKTQNVDIKAHQATFNWKTNVYVFSGSYTGESGDATAIIHGTYDATVNAPSMTFTLTPQNRQVDSLTATGPVRFEIITQPDAKGLRTKVVATATDRATYSEVSQTLQLKGNADATITQLPESPDTPSAHFTGDEIDADLASSEMTVTQAHMQVTSPLKEIVPGPKARATGAGAH